MAAAFRPVNSSLSTAAAADDAMTPSPSSATPRPKTASHPPPQHPSATTTPTRAAFAAGQKPLPTSPFPQAVQVPESADSPRRDNSQHSAKSGSRRDSMDVDMDDSDADDGSDDESVNADGSKSSKKKKSQRFYCTDYPPCNLSFTRSEHLARHIRKHTGERPFQCHCSRRFSRLDNLRQHAQTVHVNEDIPIDSLAATGSRFQRQIRTDRVRQAGNRARASTGGSAGGPARGHSKSLSTPSIASIGSVASSYSAQPDARRRPPPLVMAADPRSRLSMESYRSSAESTYSYRAPSPGDFSTPTSATFSTAQSSPRWASGVASPTSAHSRSQSMYVPGNRTPGRRLSVPSGATAFPSTHSHMPRRSLFGPGLVNSSRPAAFLSSNGSGAVTSPMAPAAPPWQSRRDSTPSAADEAWRRRTWHPDSRSFNGQLSTVGSQSVRPNPPPPIANPSSAQPSFRLPGIESFDPVPRRNPSPMAIDPDPGRRPVYQPAPAEATQPDERRNLNMYDASLQRGLTRLDIGHKTPPRDSAGAWASEVNKAVQAQAERVRLNPPTVRFEDQLPPSRQSPRSLHQQTMSAPSLTLSRDAKRHGWFHAPAAPHGVNGPRVASQDPRVTHVDRMLHPNLHGFSAFPARGHPAQQHQHQLQHHQHQQQQQQHQQHQHQQQQSQDRPANADSLRRLEALVAVATSEGSTATAY